MYDDTDLDKAAQLHRLGYHTDMDVIDLAKMIYERRQQDTNKDGESQLLRG